MCVMGNLIICVLALFYKTLWINVSTKFQAMAIMLYIFQTDRITSIITKCRVRSFYKNLFLQRFSQICLQKSSQIHRFISRNVINLIRQLILQRASAEYKIQESVVWNLAKCEKILAPNKNWFVNIMYCYVTQAYFGSSD